MGKVVTIFVSLILILSVSLGCGVGANTSDPALKTIKDELTKIGNGSWEVATIAKEGNVISIEIQVADEPGKVTFREGKMAEEVVLKVIPGAKGKMAWRSVQGIGLRTILLGEEDIAPSEG